jgi:hypothetical protein
VCGECSSSSFVAPFLTPNHPLSVTVLKRACRRLEIQRWPGRAFRKKEPKEPKRACRRLEIGRAALTKAPEPPPLDTFGDLSDPYPPVLGYPTLLDYLVEEF